MEAISDAGQRALEAVDDLLGDYKPWQICAISIAGFIAAAKTKELLFQEEPLLSRAKNSVFTVAKKIPFVRRQIDEALEDALKGIEKDLFKHATGEPLKVLPAKRSDAASLEKRLVTICEVGNPVDRMNSGKVSGTIYVGGEDYESYTKLMTKAYGMFAWTNPLHAGVFPGVRQMEAEVIAMVCNLFNGGSDACGAMSSGGTESILLSVKAHRDWARKEKGITNPNIVIPRTAHPAFDKACAMLNIGLRKVNEQEGTRAVRAADVAWAMDSNTIMIVGSCPQYPHGVVDPIADLSELAVRKNVGLHVDCCLGSFLVPFMIAAGFEFPVFDFRLPGVTAISADTHKYGYAPKGSSVVMFSNKNLRTYMYAIFPDWPGGVYGTPSIAGSRPGALVAATWVALVYHGHEGYVENTKAIVSTARKIAEGIKKIPGISLLVEPDVSVVAWASDVFDINRLVEPLVAECGWDLNVLQFPASFHLCVTMAHTAPGKAEQFLEDLAKCVAPLVATPELKCEGAGAVYGTAQAIPDRSIIAEIVSGYIDTTLQVEPLRK